MNLSDATFAQWLQTRNLPGLRIGAWLVALLLPTTWAFDWSVLPDHVGLTGSIRMTVAGFAVFILLAMRGLPRVIERNVDALSQALTIMVAACTAVIAFLHGGYSSQLFVVFLLVFLAASQLFTWTIPRAIVAFSAIAVIFIGPWVIGWVRPANTQAAFTIPP